MIKINSVSPRVEIFQISWELKILYYFIIWQNPFASALFQMLQTSTYIVTLVSALLLSIKNRRCIYLWEAVKLNQRTYVLVILQNNIV